MTIIICLGNATPRALAKHPQLGSESGLERAEFWAQEVCRLDISSVPQVGEFMKDAEGNDSYEVTAEHRKALLIEMIEKPYEVPYIGGKTRTVFEFPTQPNGDPQDTLTEMLLTIKRGWPIHSNGVPGWVSGTDEFLVMAVKRELGIHETREWLPTGERGEINYQPFGA